MIRQVPKKDMTQPVRVYVIREATVEGEPDKGKYYTSTVEKYLKFATSKTDQWMYDNKVLWIHCVIELSTGEVIVTQWSRPNKVARGGWQFSIPLTTWHYR